MIKRLFVAAVMTAMVSLPVAAQNVPSAGGGIGGFTEWWAALPVGTQVIIGGILFIVTVDGLILSDDDSKKPTPTPTPTPPPPATTTTTTS